jgi:hypothetical protein
MEALSCPRCGAPLNSGAAACPYCGVGLIDSPGAQHPPTPPVAPGSLERIAPVPPGWTLVHDPWHGFTLSHPPGWEVSTVLGQITVRLDPAGITAAAISPFTVPAPTNARQVAQQFVALAHSVIPSFQAWQQDNATPESNRITLKTRGVRFGQMVEGIYNVLVDGTNCIISGYQAPAGQIAASGAVLGRILSTYRTAALMARQQMREPGEGAFTIDVPVGWTYQAGVNRANIGGAGSLQFNIARDTQGRISANMPSYLWSYLEGMGGLFGAFTGGYPALPYMPAAQFCTQQVAPWMSKAQAGLRVERAVERPDLAELSGFDLARAGYPPGTWEVSMAILETTYDEGGVRLRQKSRVGTMRMRSSPQMWNANLDSYYRAPAAEFATWEPILAGIVGSLKVNPAWQAGEQNLAQGYIANAQRDISRRQVEISRTLSETSDIITNSYWRNQAVYDRLSEARSNAMLGYQNMAEPGRDVYKVPSGYDRYWLDGLGNVYGGSWLTQPEINWKPLEPTGI